MEIKRFVNVVDSHTGGEPTRVVLSGGPILRGGTMEEKWVDFRNNHMDFANFLMREPRGHGDMVGALLVPPCHPDATVGVIFMDNGGCLSMCGHGSIGVATVLLDTGMVQKTEPVSRVVLDTCVGLVTLDVEVTGRVCGCASMSNVPAFVFKRDCTVTLPSTGQEVHFDIAFGGNFFAIVPADQFGLELSSGDAARCAQLGLEIRDAANSVYPVKHPHIEAVDSIELVEFTKPAEGKTINCVVFGSGCVDRSPCGTGTCAKMSLLHEKGHMKPQDILVHESIAGSVFYGSFEDGPKVGPFSTIIPTVKGQAYVTGFNTLIEQAGDQFPHGFTIGRA